MSAMRVPAQIVAVPACASVSTMPLIASSETSVPSVAQSGVNEWPLPATRTGPRARRDDGGQLGLVPGRARCARGSHLTPPDQFCHVAAIVPHRFVRVVGACGSLAAAHQPARCYTASMDEQKLLIELEREDDGRWIAEVPARSPV